MPEASSRRTLEYAEAEELRLKDLDERMTDGTAERRAESRDAPFQTDYARIVRSASFRRLQGKMQMLGIDHTHFVRNRLTHSLEVCQIARHIAAMLRIREPFVVESCSLAHDIGNPPFGHHGERVLNDLAASVGGFEGNAQTFRILARLEKKHYAYGGLNLTVRTMLGVVKYYLKREGGKYSKFLYDEDFDLVTQKMARYAIDRANTIDMQIMDLADEVAYAAHDLEDCLRLRYFNIDELLYEFSRSEEFQSSHAPLKAIVAECQDFAHHATRYDTSEEYEFLFRRELTSTLVYRLVNDIAYSAQAGRLSFHHHVALARGLKSLTFKAVSNRPAVHLYEQQGERVIRGLFAVYADPTFNRGLKLLPAEYRRDTSEAERARGIADYLAGMMDSFAIQEYRRYYGPGSLEAAFVQRSTPAPHLMVSTAPAVAIPAKLLQPSPADTPSHSAGGIQGIESE